MARCHTTISDKACRSLHRLHRSSTVFGRLPTIPYRHKQLARLTSVTFVRVGNESRFKFLFSESGREECSSGRNDAPGLRVLGAKLRLHQVFWSQNLAFQSQNATVRPDFSSPDTCTFFCCYAFPKPFATIRQCTSMFAWSGMRPFWPTGEYVVLHIFKYAVSVKG